MRQNVFTKMSRRDLRRGGYSEVVEIEVKSLIEARP